MLSALKIRSKLFSDVRGFRRARTKSSDSISDMLTSYQEVCWNPLLESIKEIPTSALEVWVNDWVIGCENRESVWEEKCAKDRLDRCLDALDFLFLADAEHSGKRQTRNAESSSISVVAAQQLLDAHCHAPLRAYIWGRKRDWATLSGLDGFVAADSQYEHVFLYGVAMSGMHAKPPIPMMDQLQFVANETIKGELYLAIDNRGERPALDTAGSFSIVGEVHRIMNNRFLSNMDNWVGFDPAVPFSGPYRRRLMTTDSSAPRDVWIYEGNHLSKNRKPLKGITDWRAFANRPARQEKAPKP